MSVPIGNLVRGSRTDRWGRLGPYYAMFPVEFAFRTILAHSQKGEGVLDPFCGRGTTIYAAAALGRKGFGVEINPVGWIYGKTKLCAASQARVLQRLREIGQRAKRYRRHNRLPKFFQHAFSLEVLQFLLAARDHLDWKGSRVDRTLMAILLVYLHGKEKQALSNQMRQTKAMSPDYSIRWWKANSKVPPKIDPVAFLAPRIKWRYKKPPPTHKTSDVVLGDAVAVLKNGAARADTKYRLLLTSPPYYHVTNYNYDQWLRLWLLGGAQKPAYSNGKWQSKFASKDAYKELLTLVFTSAKSQLRDNAIIYVRTDAREFTKTTTIAVLESVFSGKGIQILDRPMNGLSQTRLYGDKSSKPGEIDVILR
jgi:DNA methylase